MIFAELRTPYIHGSSDSGERKKRERIFNGLREQVYKNLSNNLQELMREYASKLPRGKNATSGQLRVLAEC